MKKYRIFLLIGALLVLTACGPSQQVKNVNTLIAGIGAVGSHSGEAIRNAEQAYAALTDEERGEVTGYDVLQRARGQFDAMMAQVAMDAITAIGQVDAMSGGDIEAAQSAVDSLTESQLALVTNLKDLDQARKLLFEAKVQVVEDAIDSLGQITADSEDAIAEAWRIYNAANKEVQAAVGNFETLQGAEQALYAARVRAVEAAIDAIGEVGPESYEAVAEARAVYDAAGAEIQASVSNLDLLLRAEDQLDQLRVKEVEDAIDAIGTVTLDSGEAIRTARALYDRLPDELIFAVQNIDALTAAENKLERLKREQQDEVLYGALDKLNFQPDMEQGVNWYYAKCEPYYCDERSFVLPYIGVNAEGSWLRLKYHYTGTEWVFFEKVTLIVDGEEFVREFDYFDVQRGNDTEVWEWADFEPDRNEIEMLRKMAGSKQTVVRFEGKDYYFEFTVSEQDKAGTTEVLDAFEIMLEQEEQKEEE